MKPVLWAGGSKKDLEGMPYSVRLEIRAAIFAAQSGSRVGYAKPLRGSLREVMEVVAHDRGGAYRGMYYVGKELIYALHFFQKKSKHGIKTPKKELDLVRCRLARARRHEQEAR